MIKSQRENGKTRTCSRCKVGKAFLIPANIPIQYSLCKVNNAHEPCTLYTVQCTGAVHIHIPKRWFIYKTIETCTLYTVHLTLYTVNFTLYTVQFTSMFMFKIRGSKDCVQVLVRRPGERTELMKLRNHIGLIKNTGNFNLFMFSWFQYLVCILNHEYIWGWLSLTP